MLTNLCRSQLNDRNNAFPFHDPATGTVDCNVACVSEAIELWNGVQHGAKEIRQATNQATGPTGNTLARRAFAFAGMQAAIDYRMMGRAPVQDVRDLLAAGWFVTLYVDCGKLQDTAPEMVGDRRYRGAHAVSLFDIWRGSDGVQVHLANPLFDGRRRSGWTAPKGVQVARFVPLRDAGYAFAGSAGLAGWAVRPPK